MKPSIELKFYKYEKSERADSSNPFLFFSYLQPINLLLKCLLLMLSVLNNLSITKLLPIFSLEYLPSQSLLASSGIGTHQTSTTPVIPWESLCFSLMRRYTHLPRKGFGSMINGFIPANQAGDYRSSLQEGDIFEVANFEVERCPHMYKVMEHTFVIRFIAQTTFFKFISKDVHQMADVVGQIQSVKGYGLTNPQVISPLLISFLIEPSHDKTWINDKQVSSIGDLNMFFSNTTDQVNSRDGNHGSGPRVWPVKDCRGTVLEQESEKKAILVTFPQENTRSSDDEDSRSGDDDSSSDDDDSSSSDDDSSFRGVLICTCENCKINENPCVDVKCEEASASASAIKMSTAEVKQGGRKLPRQLCNIFQLFKKSISTMYLTRG
ncbi:hypothetical protein HID58_065612 [Brassica napus]|uniref:Uncharacterized protein n=1 Tax=Brassica napus TaxID=3708 RepID=A0ABQ7ZDN0_BRANA|nr:hypothetical protein HID58_065612 [Brassica napus]